MRGRSAGNHRPVIAVEFNGRRFDYVCILPESGISEIESNCRTAVHAHGSSRDVYGAGRRQERAAGLQLQITVGSFDVAFGESFSGRAMEAHRGRSRSHASISHTRRAGEYQYLIGRSIASMVAPGFALAVDVGNASLLYERLDAGAGLGRGIKNLT